MVQTILNPRPRAEPRSSPSHSAPLLASWPCALASPLGPDPTASLLHGPAAIFPTPAPPSPSYPLGPHSSPQPPPSPPPSLTVPPGPFDKAGGCLELEGVQVLVPAGRRTEGRLGGPGGPGTGTGTGAGAPSQAQGLQQPLFFFSFFLLLLLFPGAHRLHGNARPAHL